MARAILKAILKQQRIESKRIKAYMKIYIYLNRAKAANIQDLFSAHWISLNFWET